MATMDDDDFKSMVEITPVTTCLIEYYGHTDNRFGCNKLVAAALTDILGNGLSMVYTYFDPTLAWASLGTFMILDHVNIAKTANFSHLYLGYWIPGSEKMEYKSGFSASEVYRRANWWNSLNHWRDRWAKSVNYTCDLAYKHPDLSPTNRSIMFNRL